METTKQYDEKRTQLHNQIKSLIDEWKNHPEGITEFLKFSSRFYEYSLDNRILIAQRNEGAQFVGSFNKFKSMGYSVLKGQKGMKIFVPTTVTLYKDPENNDWRKISKAPKKIKEEIKKGNIKTKQPLRFKIGSVFDISQTNCPPENYPEILGIGTASEKHSLLCEGVEKYCNSIGVAVEYSPLNAGQRGYYNRLNNTVTISNLLEDSGRLSTLTHELSHALMHYSFYSVCYNLREPLR